jgi:hypothetical protein
MEANIKRHKGGQPGNRNALKRGYYSRALNRKEKHEFSLAAGIEGIDEEISLLRFEIKKAIQDGDLADLVPLSKAAFALEKLVRTRHKIFSDSRQNQLEKALENVFRNVILPMGPELTLLIASKKFPHVLDEVVNANRINESAPGTKPDLHKKENE